MRGTIPASGIVFDLVGNGLSFGAPHGSAKLLHAIGDRLGHLLHAVWLHGPSGGRADGSSKVTDGLEAALERRADRSLGNNCAASSSAELRVRAEPCISERSWFCAAALDRHALRRSHHRPRAWPYRCLLFGKHGLGFGALAFSTLKVLLGCGLKL